MEHSQSQTQKEQRITLQKNVPKMRNPLHYFDKNKRKKTRGETGTD